MIHDELGENVCIQGWKLIQSIDLSGQSYFSAMSAPFVYSTTSNETRN